MMEYNDQLKLQAYLDGELTEGEAAQWAERLAGDQEAAALLTELRQTRECMGGFEEGVKLTETREFYWSKIQREIQRLDMPRPAATATLTVWGRLRRLLVPAAGLALITVAALVATYHSGSTLVATETAVADSGAMVYHDYAAGATFVWLSYPADDEVVDNDEEATLD